MENFIKGIIVTIILIYILSPVDACPGPIDDLVVALLGLSKCRKLSK